MLTIMDNFFFNCDNFSHISKSCSHVHFSLSHNHLYRVMLRMLHQKDALFCYHGSLMPKFASQICRMDLLKVLIKNFLLGNLWLEGKFCSWSFFSCWPMVNILCGVLRGISTGFYLWSLCRSGLKLP